MGKIHIFTYSLILCIVLSLALLAFVFCILAEFKKSKVRIFFFLLFVYKIYINCTKDFPKSYFSNKKCFK